MNSSQKPTSWQPVSKWYNQSVGSEGQYYHQHVVLPNLLRLLQLTPQSAVLDLACGQGVLERAIDEKTQYCGVDLAPDLITYAKKSKKNSQHEFSVADVSKPLSLRKQTFTHVVCVLALQNIRNPEGVVQNAARYLEPNGSLTIVLNHPCFRIPRQSSWGIDETKKTQYRRIDRYMSELEVPITAHPGHRTSEVTWSFHKPLSAYTKLLTSAEFVIDALEEWNSDKVSQGKTAKMENRGRQEFPLFLTLVARKNK